VRNGIWLQNPSDRIDQVRRPKYLPRPFSDAEINAIWALDLTPREAIVRHLLLYTGLRVSPICALKVGDIVFSPATIRAWVKGAKHQVIQMHPELVEPLQSFIRNHTDGKAHSLLLTDGGRHPERRVIERMTRRWGQRAGVALCLPHRFRHTFATQLIRSGINPRIVKEMLGHEDFSSTMLYTLVTESDEATAMAKLSWAKRS
jgi:integrase/recombinase XerD